MFVFSVANILMLIIALAAPFGLMYHSGLLRGCFRADMFVYYTNLSNLLVAVYYIGRVVCTALRVSDGAAYALFLSPLSHFTVAICITVTFIIYHFIIRPTIVADPQAFGEFGNVWSVSNLFVHYIVPLLTLADFLIFGEHAQEQWWFALVWVLLPLAYAAFAFIRARGGKNITGTDSPYPYGFIDINQIGIKAVKRNVVVILAAFVVLGFAFFGVGRLLS